MGNLEVGRIEGQIIEEQDIDIDGTVAIAFSLVMTSEFAFNLLGDLEYLTRQERRLTTDGTVKEHVAGCEAPRTCLDDRRLANDLSYALANKLYGTGNLRCPVALIRAQSQINRVYQSSTIKSASPKHPNLYPFFTAFV